MQIAPDREIRMEKSGCTRAKTDHLQLRSRIICRPGRPHRSQDEHGHPENQFMSPAVEIIPVTRAIQQAVAPVFLLAGVGGLLSVLSARLARIIDRYRILNGIDNEKKAKHVDEMKSLLSRARWIHWAITLCTVCALLICIVIASLFIGTELNRDPSRPISMFFIVAMTALTAGLVCFLREIALAMGDLK